MKNMDPMNGFQMQRSVSHDGGFSLVEMFIVIVLMGVLAVIALPTFLNQRENARESALRSDLRNGALAMESYFVGTGRYPTEQDRVLEALGLPESDQVTLEIVVPRPADDGQTYCLSGSHALLNDGQVLLTYAPERGGITEDTTCP